LAQKNNVDARYPHRISTIATVKMAAAKSSDNALAPAAVELYVCIVSVIDERFEISKEKPKSNV
jgi:hypothetical protein